MKIKTKRGRLLIAVTLMLSIVLSMNVSLTSAADISNTPEARTIVMTTKAFYAETATKAYASIMATSSGFTPYITSKMTLQSAPLGSTNFTNDSSASPSTFTVRGDTSIMHNTYFTITKNKNYRVKYEVTDCVNDMTITSVSYKTLDR